MFVSLRLPRERRPDNHGPVQGRVLGAGEAAGLHEGQSRRPSASRCLVGPGVRALKSKQDRFDTVRFAHCAMEKRNAVWGTACVGGAYTNRMRRA